MSMTISHEQTVAIALELNRELARALQRCDEACELGEELAVLGQRWKEAARTVMTDAQFAEYEKAIEQPSPTLGEK